MTEPATAPPADWRERAVHELVTDWRKLTGHCPGCGSPEPRLHPRDALGIKLCPDPYHGGAPAAPADLDIPAIPATQTITQEEPVQLAADLHSIADRIERIGEEGFTDVEKILANPDAARLLKVAASLAPAPLSPLALAMVGTLETLAAQDNQGQPQGVASDHTAAAAVTNQG